METTQMGMAERIKSRLTEVLAPAALDIVDESAMHAGHGGARPGGETHFRIRVVADAFAGKSRLQRHRLIYDALAAEIADGVHALSFDARPPGD